MLTTAQTHPTLVKQLRTPLTSHCFSCMLMVTSYALYTTGSTVLQWLFKGMCSDSACLNARN